ncbi:MAG: hypothetical protein M1120_00120 [Patescibacteria group bacterium]|nr:hypothetical protein [Patescibacteria group bacterium]
MKITSSQILAILYADIFDYPLKKDELERWQIKDRYKNYNDYNNYKVYTYKNGYFCPYGREKIINLRQQRKKYSQQKIHLAKKTVQLLQKIPFIKLVAITGALSMYNSPQEDDIDLLIVTEKNRLWISRFLVSIFLDVLGKRRRPKDTNFQDKICLNMFLEESKLQIPRREQNLYTAHEVCQIMPIYNKLQTYEKFLSANKWTKKYLPNGVDNRILGYYDTRRNKDKSRIIVISKYHNIILDFLEYTAYKLQYIYMKSRMTRETVERKRAFFHPLDRTNWVLKEFNKRLKEINW